MKGNPMDQRLNEETQEWEDIPGSDAGPHIRPFAELLLQVAKGKTHEDLTVAWNELVLRCLELDGAGSVTLTLEVKVVDDQTRQLGVTPKVSSKLPQPKPRPSTFWADLNGNVTRQNPDQPELPGVMRGL